MKQSYRTRLSFKNRLWEPARPAHELDGGVDPVRQPELCSHCQLPNNRKVLEQLAGQRKLSAQRAWVEAAEPPLLGPGFRPHSKRVHRAKARERRAASQIYAPVFAGRNDPPSMTVEQLLASLPNEFERWLKTTRISERSSDEVYQSAAPL